MSTLRKPRRRLPKTRPAAAPNPPFESVPFEVWDPRLGGLIYLTPTAWIKVMRYGTRSQRRTLVGVLLATCALLCTLLTLALVSN